MAIARPAALALALGALAACVTPERLEGVNWSGARETPAGQEFTPEAANARGIAGLVLLRCVADEQLRAQDCAVIYENPPGWGFGAGALRMSPNLKGEDAGSYGGRPPRSGEVFNIPIMFCPPERLTTCRPQLRNEVWAFVTRIAPADAALKAGDCARAQALAEASGLASYARWVARRCARSA